MPRLIPLLGQQHFYLGISISMSIISLRHKGFPSPCLLSALGIKDSQHLLSLHLSGSFNSLILSWSRSFILTLFFIQMVFIITKALIPWVDNFCSTLTGFSSSDPVLCTSTSYHNQSVNPARAARFTCYFNHMNSKLRPSV